MSDEPLPIEAERQFADLPRRFGAWTGGFVVVASMVGVGILTTSGYTIHATGSHPALLLLWGVGGVLAVCAAMTVAEMSTAMPHVGGDYVFVREAFGPAWGFVFGWATLLCGFAGPTAVVAHATAEYMLRGLRSVVSPYFVEYSFSSDHAAAWAIVLVIVFTIVHCLGQDESALAQIGSTLFKICTLAVLVGAGLASPHGSLEHLTSGVPLSQQSPAPLAVGLIYVMYSYTGWNAAAYLAGEMKDAPRNLPRSLLGGCLAVTVLYLLLNLTYAYALDPLAVQKLPIQEVEAIAELASSRLFGQGVSGSLSLIIGLGILASLSAYIMTGPRVAVAMARHQLLPRVIGQLHARRSTPVPALLLQCVIAIVFLVFGSFRQLLDFTSVGLALLSGLMVSSIFVLRKRADLVFSFRMPLYPLPPLLYLAFTAWMVTYAVLDKPLPSLVCLSSIFLAVPVYMVAKR